MLRLNKMTKNENDGRPTPIISQPFAFCPRSSAFVHVLFTQEEKYYVRQ